jgi:hypothetical protein
MSNIIPSVGMKGNFSATAPFSAMLNPQLMYQCIAVESINALIARGKNPIAEVYEVNGLGNTVWQIATINDYQIITLRASSGVLVNIPENYLLGLPDANGIKYSCMMLGISLSALPDSFDLSTVKQEVSDLIFARLGVRSEIKTMMYGTSNILSQTEASSVESARVANITNNNSNLSRVNMLVNQNAALLAKVAVLENYAKLHP